MTIDERIRVLDKLLEDFLLVNRAVEQTRRQMDALYDRFITELASIYVTELELASAVRLWLASNEEYQELDAQWLALRHQRDEMASEMEIHRWRLLEIISERASALPMEFFTTSMMGSVKH